MGGCETDERKIDVLVLSTKKIKGEEFERGGINRTKLSVSE